MKKIYSIIIMFICIAGVEMKAQSDTGAFSLGLDLVSRYVWRGLDFGGSPSIQPSLAVTPGNIGVELGAWGAYTTNLPGTQELDLHIAYSPIEMFTLTITDYFFPDEVAGYKYFDYASKSTGHVMEGMISFNGTDEIPLNLLFAINFFGDDAKDHNGEMVYSKYAEVGYAFEAAGTNIETFLGMALDDPDEQKGAKPGFYNQLSWGVINVGTTIGKELVISKKFSIPLKASLIFNPERENAYLVIGMSF